MLIFGVCLLFCFGKLSAGKLLSDGLVTRFDDLVNRFKQEFIKEERKKIQAEVEVFNTYKQGLNVSDDEIIQFNVGGQKFTTTRSTLRQINGLMISTFHSKAYFISLGLQWCLIH